MIFTIIAFTWALDIIEIVDPFKFYNPSVPGFWGIFFIVFLFALSLFIYRPWCHLFCPFGLIGWFAEKISVFKIAVNYDTCIACKTCAKACPSNVMDSILRRENVIPDCFSCATCINVCPTDSIEFKSGKRNRPPVDKFKK
jgi:polyferredoxin